jgi:hypothetical protein
MDRQSELEKLLEERVSDVEQLEGGHEEFMEVAEELEDNIDAYDREDTLKHGTAAENIDSIVEDGLIPGKENNSTAGEAGDQNWVRMTHPFPIALKYGVEAFPEREKVVSKANDWAEFLGKNIADWSPEVDIDSTEGMNAVINPEEEPGGPLYGELYTHLVNAVEKLELIDAGEVDTDPVVLEVPYSSAEYVHVPWGEEHPEELEDSRREIDVEGIEQAHYTGENVAEYGLLEKTEDEVEAVNQGKLAPDDPLQETKITSAELGGQAAVYVPHDRLEEFREKYSGEDFSVLSIEARSLQHELRMQDRYREEGTVSYRTPWDIEGKMIHLKWDEAKYDPNPGTIDISG